MQRARTTKSDHGEIGDVLAVLDGMDAASVRHVLIHHLAGAVGRRFRIEAEDGTDIIGHRLAAGRDGKGDGAAGKIVRVEFAEDEIGVRHGRIPAAALVAGRPRLGCGGMRPDADLAHAVDRGDGASAGANLHHLHDRNGNRHAGALAEPIGARHLEGLGRLRHLVFDQADLGRRAAHIEGKHRIEPVAAGDVGREDRAAGRAGFDEANREFRGAFHRNDASAGVDHEDRAPHADLPQRDDEAVEIGFDRRLHIGVGADGVEALEFPHLRRDFGGDRYGHVWQAL